MSDPETIKKQRKEDFNNGFRFYEERGKPFGDDLLYRFFGINITSCGRVSMRSCYYIEGIEGNEDFERSIELGTDLVERIESVRTFVKPVAENEWEDRLVAIRKGIHGAREHQGDMIVYEGCAQAQRQHLIPPCYQYIGDLRAFAAWINKTHKHDWATSHTRRIRRSQSKIEPIDPETEPANAWRANFKDHIKKS